MSAFTFMTETEAARALLAHYGAEGGIQTGSFGTKLIEAFERADPMNTERLLKGFPEFRMPIMISKIYDLDAVRAFADTGKLP